MALSEPDIGLGWREMKNQVAAYRLESLFRSQIVLFGVTPCYVRTRTCTLNLAPVCATPRAVLVLRPCFLRFHSVPHLLHNAPFLFNKVTLPRRLPHSPNARSQKVQTSSATPVSPSTSFRSPFSSCYLSFAFPNIKSTARSAIITKAAIGCP